MSAPILQCPDCGGHPMAGHPAGLLELSHTITCNLLVAEDATRNADWERGSWAFSRPATATELQLIGALGLLPPTSGQIDVTHLTNAVRRRSWTPA